ncbi:hypothetical protein [Tautonia sociabilis]|uniref:Uncharacterized protein n=1 Tax=Tautonia sociabilis TaxID=2080755 RepID=A0A432MLX8_9BACT|nr:hypothetical protein [Tautonia sociabilis]RUL88136.1 hypothetical protein TsocGM_08315 [Tautonia sociabilis]
MPRVLTLLFAMVLTVAVSLAGCGPSPPEPTGEAYEPPKELDQMKAQMLENYKKGTVNKAQ